MKNIEVEYIATFYIRKDKTSSFIETMLNYGYSLQIESHGKHTAEISIFKRRRKKRC